MLQSQHRLDQTRRSRRRVRVPDIALHRAQGAETDPVRAVAKRLLEGGDLDRIAEGRRRAVGFDVADRLGVDPGDLEGLREDRRLAVDARGGETNLVGAVVVDRRAEDHRLDRIAVGEGVGEALQDHYRGAARADGPLGAGVEGTAMAVGGGDASLPVSVAGDLRQDDRRPAGEGEIAFPEIEGLAGQVDRHQGGRASGLKSDRRTAQIELVGHPGGEEILVVGEHRLVARHAPKTLRIGGHMAEIVGVEPGAPEDPDPRRRRRLALPHAAVTGALEGLERTLEEKPVLRGHQGGLMGRQVEKPGVEALDIVEDPRRPDIAFPGQVGLRTPGRAQLLVAEKTDRLDPTDEVLPERLDVRRAGQAAAHGEDGDADRLLSEIVFRGVEAFLSTHLPPR